MKKYKMSGQEIKDAVEEIIRKCDHEDFNEAINWGNLHVIEVNKIQALWPEKYESIEVLIEEAAPNCYGLRAHIGDELKRRYGVNFIARAEW